MLIDLQGLDLDRVSERMKSLVASLRKDCLLFDLGCDHGLIGLYALKIAVAQKVIFVDQSAKALQALQLFRQGLPEAQQALMEIRCQSLESLAIPSELPSDFILAGVGIKTMVRALDRLFPTGLGKHRLILSPEKESSKLRLVLRERQILLLEEKVCFEQGRYREILSLGSHGRQVPLLQDAFLQASDSITQAYRAYLESYLGKVKQAQNRPR